MKTPVPPAPLPSAPPHPAGVPAAAPSALDRPIAWTAALLLVVGSVLFLAGGRAHPSIGAGIGAGPADFFRAFADRVHHTPGWHGMHMRILVGPLFWAVAAPALVDALRPEVRALTSVARSALLLSGALWAAAFVLDGYGAPVYAEAAVGAGTADAAGIMTSFRANAVIMSRLGLVSWVMGGVGMMALGAALLAPGGRTGWRTGVGVAGVLAGAWPLLAALEGEYAGGPFTSRYWVANAVVVAAWYVALAGCAARRRYSSS